MLISTDTCDRQKRTTLENPRFFACSKWTLAAAAAAEKRKKKKMMMRRKKEEEEEEEEEVEEYTFLGLARKIILVEVRC
ncbi:hypothetical protein M0804_005382 [Polistes exclamans]|nr:hypothetical protein M0804_005382 [Polistes exclamans]